MECRRINPRRPAKFLENTGTMRADCANTRRDDELILSHCRHSAPSNPALASSAGSFAKRFSACQSPRRNSVRPAHVGRRTPVLWCWSFPVTGDKTGRPLKWRTLRRITHRTDTRPRNLANSIPPCPRFFWPSFGGWKFRPQRMLLTPNFRWKDSRLTSAG